MKKLSCLLLLIPLLCAALFFIAHYLFLMHAHHALSQQLGCYHYILMIWRYAFYIFILMFWPDFIKLIGVRQHWPAETIVYLSHQRIKLLALFMIFEIFFVFNVVGKVLGGL